MTVYVDDIQQFPSGSWCHMMTDGELAELHEIADKLGLRRYFQNHAWHPHYDLRPSKRREAILLGAVEVEATKMLLLCLRGESNTPDWRRP